MKRLMFLFALLFCALFLTGCAQANLPMDQRWASVEGGQINQAQAGEEFYFTVPVDPSMLAPARAPINIKVSGKVTSGALRFELRAPTGQPVWTTGRIGPGDFAMQTSYQPEADQAGKYMLGLVYEANTSAGYQLSWHALQLSPAVLFPGIGMLLLAFAFAFYGVRRSGWRYLGLGALFWVLTVALKFAFAIPVNPAVYKALDVSYQTPFSVGNLVAYVYIGALTGVFESGVAWLILRRSRWGRASWSQALVFGIGFGAFEALLLGLGSLGSAATGLLSPGALPVPTLASLARSANLLTGMAPIVERLSVILAHIFACVLIFYAIASRKASWAWLSILYKTLLDTPGGFAAFWGVTSSLGKLWTIEAVIAVFGLIGLWDTILIARRYPRQQQPESVLISKAAPAD